MPASTDHTSRTLQARRDSTFLVLAGLFLGTLGMLNILGLTRFLQLGHIGTWPIVVAIGALPYPITFLCTDLISELWGEEKANQLVWVGLLLNGWVVLILWLGGLLPGLPGSDDSTFRTIQELSFGAIGASMAAYLTAQFIDVRLFHFWKQLTNGKALWLRNNGSTLVSQLVDICRGVNQPLRSPCSTHRYGESTHSTTWQLHRGRIFVQSISCPCRHVALHLAHGMAEKMA